VLGAYIALALPASLALAAAIIGVFAIFHGHAHGAELLALADPVAYAIGFALATGLLHLLGIAFGQWPAGRVAVPVAGALMPQVSGSCWFEHADDCNAQAAFATSRRE
jgi:urease accessory protein